MMQVLYQTNIDFIRGFQIIFFTVRNACKEIISPMSFTFVL